jgi:choline dehydrogenase-like flavoprotein
VESPALLLRSGLSNPNIGQHLRLHPVAVVAGQYAEPIHAWEGSLQTVYSRQFANLTGNYGIWFEVAPAHPGLLSLATPWDGGQAFKTEMLRAPHLAAMIVLARDTGEGSVTLDRYGDPVLDYFPNATDQKHLIRGMRELVKVAMAGGAVGAATLHSPTLRFEADNLKPGGYTEKRLSAHLDEITARGLRPNAPMLFSAHQMGTARMGGSAKTAVTDPFGKVWGVHGLYVGDGSLLPTAPGVNPMLSIYGAAYRVGQAILAEG